MNASLNLIAHPLVVQHNALVNARLDLNTTESRLFLALLARINRDDSSFALCQISARDILDGTASNNFEHVKRMLKQFAGRTLSIEKLGPEGRTLQERKFVVIPLLAYAEYRDGEGVIEAQFNDHLRGYLLELRDNFTKAQLTELLKLKSASSYRIYWLLREYAAFGKRTISVEELKAILGLSEEYDRFNNFRVRVLDRAQQELAETDLPFTYELVKHGRTITDVRFLFQPLDMAALPQVTVAWEVALLEVGISVASLNTVRSKLEAGDYDDGYVFFVLQEVLSKVKAGKVKKPGGAVFKALVDGYLLPAYQKTKLAPASAGVKASPALSRQRKKLLSELEDARKSLGWAQTAVIYSEDTRPAAVAKIKAAILSLEQQLLTLGSPTPILAS